MPTGIRADVSSPSGTINPLVGKVGETVNVIDASVVFFC